MLWRRRNRKPSDVKVVLYLDKEEKTRWRAVAKSNGKILATSSEAYNDPRDARQAISALWPDGVEIEER